MRVPAIRLVLTVGLGLLVPPSPGFGETGSVETQPAVGHFSHVDGSVTHLRRFTPRTARVGLVLVAGDQVHVAMGRAEITLTDGSALQLDQHTRVALHAVDRFEVLDGRVFVHSSGAGPLIAQTGGRRVHLAPGGAVEVTTANSDLLVRVVDGDARIESSWGSEAVTATQSALVSGPTSRPFVGPWVARQHDAFHQWAGGRMVVLVPPPAFLPYAHPTYRQQEYQRVLRHQRFERRRGGDRQGDDDRNGAQARRDHRRGRDHDTRLPSEASARQAARREPRTPPAKAPAATPRGMTAALPVGRPPR